MATNSKENGAENEDTFIEKTIELLNWGEKEMQLLSHLKKIILVVGDTGNGKTMFTKWITGDVSDLTANELRQGSEEYVINFIKKKKSATITSDTVYPTLYIDHDTQTAVYDCSGFNDTRHTRNDVATTYFIKKLVNYADSVKIIFIINYPSVRSGVERCNFMRLLEQATEFIKNVKKFKASIALVATKVDNTYSKDGKFVDDSQVMELIADFFKEVEQEILLRMQDCTFMEQQFYEEAIKIISYFLEKKEGKYTKIGIFRRPDTPGHLSKSLVLENGRENIRKMLFETLAFVDKAENDFGYTISWKSKNYIGRFVNKINESVWCSVNEIVDEIKQYYLTLSNEMRKTMKTLKRDDALGHVEEIQAKFSLFNLREAQASVSHLIEGASSVSSPYKLAQMIKFFSAKLEIAVSERCILNTENKGKYYDFLQVYSADQLDTRSWDQPFRSLEACLSEIRENILIDFDDIAPEIHEKILSCIESIAENLRYQMDAEIKLLDILVIPKTLKIYSDYMMCLIERNKNVKDIKKFLTTVHDITCPSMLNIPNDKALSIIRLENYLKLLQNFCQKDYKPVSISWVHPFQKVTNHLSESKIWYDFLDSFYKIFSEYEIQKDKKKYFEDFGNWGKADDVRGISFWNSNFGNFLQILSSHNIAVNETIENIMLNEMRLEEVNQILNLTLKQRLTVERLERLIFITDDYITISNLTDSTKANSFFSVLKSERIKLIKTVCIFASRTIFIDEDLTLPGLNLGIIAPKWEIIGKRKIILNGLDAEAHPIDKANDGNDENRNGEHGLPGLRGKSGGSFFGIGETFVNGANLTITANGGNGSPGQHGGDGLKGEKGDDARMPFSDDSHSHQEIVKGLESIRGFSCRKTGGANSATGSQFHADYVIVGRPGKRGGKGGNGGAGGAGGNAGTINLYELDAMSRIVKHSNPGLHGRHGNGGKGGEGGDGGNHIYARCEMSRPCCPVFSRKNEYTQWNEGPAKTSDSQTQGSNGENGADGEVADTSDRDPENTISDPTKIVNTYKLFLIKYFNCRFRSAVLFFNKISENFNVKSMYNIIRFVHEFQMLEDKLHCFSLKPSHCIFIYKSVMSRISEHLTRIERPEEVRDYMEVLKYLCAAILGKICILSDKSEKNLTVDIVEYLEKINGDIKNLTEIRLLYQNPSLMDKQKENDINVNDRIQEIKIFIMEHILPEINITRKQIDDNIHLLIEEIISLQGDAGNECYIVTKQQELENTLALKQVFINFKLISKVVNFLCIVGTLTLSVIQRAGSGEDISVEEDLITFFEAVENVINDVSNETVNFLNNLFNGISNEAENYPETMHDLLPMVEVMNTWKNNVSGRSLGLMEIKKMEIDLKLRILEEEEKLRSENCESTEDALQIISKLSKMACLGSLLVNIVTSNDKETAKLEELFAAIKRSDKRFLALKQHEINIFDSISLMVKNIQDNIFDSNSRIVLDTTKWRVQSTLKNIQLHLKVLIRGFKGEENISCCFYMLQETMTTLITVFDHIENYLECQFLVSSVGAIGPFYKNHHDVSNQELLPILDKLNGTVKSNLILSNYKMALDTFRQWVFPLSQNYIVDSMLPNHLLSERNVDKLMSACVEHMDHMKTKVEVYKTSMMNNGHYTRKGEFNFSNEPFFVWKNEKHKILISRLLSGQEIILKADVKKSPTDKDAIKFSFIEFQFKCKNEPQQTELEQLLDRFDVIATHMGNSYYRCGNKIYVITSDKQTIHYSFERNAKGESVRINAGYEKIRKGGLMLSPYATWKLKLIDTNNITSFDQMRKFENDMDLYLVGYGCYAVKDYQLVDEDYRIVEKCNEYEKYLE